MSTWEERAPSCLRSEAGVYGECLEVYRKYLEVSGSVQFELLSLPVLVSGTKEKFQKRKVNS